MIEPQKYSTASRVWKKVKLVNIHVGYRVTLEKFPWIIRNPHGGRRNRQHTHVPKGKRWGIIHVRRLAFKVFSIME